ncbi:MAG TPA: glycoside hydrolase family 3 C-terminal domain-containing protein, partial [Rhizomicrobium sp.]|nr:glycoside hydrolase family 3 C-terminal domain-containing protein [Rhizomicrobium sp.]
MNAALPPDQRADLIQAQMTQDEQLSMLMGYYGSPVQFPFARTSPPSLFPVFKGTAGYVPGVPRLGIPALYESDGPVGIADSVNMRPGQTATAMPSTLLTAATFDPGIAHTVGAAIGNEARERGFNVMLAGAINLTREPRGGRNFEYAGEDPLLAGVIVGSTIAGIQSEHIVSTVKHYALNSQETGRGVYDATVGEQEARESDLLAFQIAIERGEPGSVMCAYNLVNEFYSCENKFLLTDVLKGDWRFPGWVMSDWGGVHSTIAAANTGLDQESATGFDRQEYFGAALKQALASGAVAPARMHDMVHRILRTLFAKGVFDFSMAPPPVQFSEHVAVAQKDAEEGIVLLKNNKAALPLSPGLKRIALIGRHAEIGMMAGSGSSLVMPIGHNPADIFPVGAGVVVASTANRVMPAGLTVFDPPSPLAALQVEAPGAEIQLAQGDDIDAAVALARRSDVAIIFAQQWTTETQDVPSLALAGNQDALIAAVAAVNPHTIVVLNTGGPVLMPWLDKVQGVVEAWYPGNGGATAVARILFGRVSPSGKLPITFPVSEDQLPRPVIPGLSNPNAPFALTFPEGADVGYRWYVRQHLTPLFPFGFGLSYTSFTIRNVTVTGGDTATVGADITNSGAIEGAETIQAYAVLPTDAGSGVPRLIGWARADLKAGE